jgi:hypothetical protein
MKQSYRKGIAALFLHIVPLVGLLLCSCDLEVSQSVGGRLYIESEPEGAEVSLNGTPQGETPTKITGLGAGEYVIELNKDGYDPLYKTVGLLDGQEVDIELEMTKTTGLLLVDSTPGGSEVIIKGEVKGTTPALVTDLPLGDYQIEIRTAGLPPRLVTVELVDRKPVREHVRHAPRVAVNSYPPGAEIVVDNELIGTAPLTLSEIPEGSHKITARLKEYDSQEKVILLTPGLNDAIEFNLEKNSGTLVLDTEPALVQVFVDGTLFATTQPKEGADSISQPLRIALKAGVGHQIQLVREGYNSASLVLTTEIDQVVTQHEVLKRIFVRDTRITTNTEVINCRLEYKLPNGDIYYERYPGVYNTARASEIRGVQPISLDDASNREARRMIEQSRQLAPQ